MCAYAIRESRIGRVIFGLLPLLGGHSRWDILKDTALSSVMPEVFAPPPYVLAGCLCQERKCAAFLVCSIHSPGVQSRAEEYALRGHASEKHEANAVPELRLKRQFAN
ncbi:hypothetical protein [Bradyrhizobium stylosanthis]|uniref:Uncharacterized protein n=1 Tax=Bradyrhizobium stylosanthis TaxID=1803665 RepID=A0A560DPM7_9BRAD|nr:hypothetical protein [Bradyrhizobium stylosanthis]TWA98992.1 hypothetical protein FBZ96_105671 [Bradyrhizobium stylosanthis]